MVNTQYPGSEDSTGQWDSYATDGVSDTDTIVEPGADPVRKTVLARATGFSLALAVFVFLVNMVAAWWITGESSEVIGRPLVQETQTAVSLAMQGASGASANNHVLLNRVLDTELMLRTAQNRHTITVVSLSVAFSLVAIGFALFVMGAEGAFRLEGVASKEKNLMVKATAPGLLCFVLAAVVVIVALMSKTELRPGGFNVYPDAGASEYVAGSDLAGSNSASVSAVVEQAPQGLAPESEPVPDGGSEQEYWDDAATDDGTGESVETEDQTAD